VLRAVDQPVYEQGVLAQIEEARSRQGEGSLDELLRRGETWTVGADGAITEGVAW